MRKILTLALALVLVLSLSLNAFADGFDADTVLIGTVEIANGHLDKKVVASVGNEADNYHIDTEDGSVNSFFYISRMNANGDTLTEGVYNHIGYSMSFPTDESTLEGYYDFFITMSTSLLQCVTGGDYNALEMQLHYAVANAEEDPTLKPALTYSFTVAGYECEVVILASSNVAFLGLVIEQPGLNG